MDSGPSAVKLCDLRCRPSNVRSIPRPPLSLSLCKGRAFLMNYGEYRSAIHGLSMGLWFFLACRSEHLCCSLLRSLPSHTSKSTRPNLRHYVRFSIARLRHHRVCNRPAIWHPMGVFLSLGRQSLWAGRIFRHRPFSAALAVFFVGASILLLRGEPTHAGTTWKISSIYLKLWRGQYSLGRSFWGFFILGTCIAWIVGILSGFLLILYPPTLLIFRLLFLGYLITAAVGVWRSSNATAHHGRRHGTFVESAKSLGAKTMVIVIVLVLALGAKIELLLRSLY